MTAPPTPDELKTRLGARIRELAEALIPGGKIEGREWIGIGPDGAKWGVVIAGAKLGTYQNFGAGKGGRSGLGLIRDAVTEGDPRRAYAWALKFLGDDVLLPSSMQRPAPAAPPPSDDSARNAAKSLFLSGREFGADDVAGRYLLGRGISLRPGLQMPALRSHSRCWNTDARRHFPAMLGAVIDPLSAAFLAVHRTYLDAGTGRKAPVPRAKKVLGSYVGGVIPLTRGASDKRLRDAPEGDACLIAEGIENALTAAQWFPERRALAAVAIGNLPDIALPPTITRVLLIRDRDGENQSVMATRYRAVGRWENEGRAVEVWEPPEDCKDANEYWQQVKAGIREA